MPVASLQNTLVQEAAKEGSAQEKPGQKGKD